MRPTDRKTTTLAVALCLSIVLLTSIHVVIGFGQTDSPARKLSSHLQMLTSTDPDQVNIGKKHVHLKSAGKYAEPMVDALVRFQGDPKALEAYGARVRSILGNVATMDIPLKALETIASHPHVIRIEEARKLKHRLDISVPASGANGLGLWGNAPNPAGSSGAKLRPLPPPWTGNTGQNVIVGDVDTGIDLNHADFKDSLGNSRILYVWDQTSNGTPPAEFSYGNECTNQQINNGTCTQTDSEGHGTHVMGIAAGNGSATGNGQLAYRYVGMAPQADLIMVNTDFYDSDIIDGVSYIQSKAAALSLPSVVNLSLGGHFGPHDGTSNFEVAMDAASGTGKVVVVAAGNEAADNIHASGTVANGGTVAVSFSVPSGSTDVLLDLWYPGADQLGVNIVSPSGSCTIPSSGFRYPGNSDFSSNTNCGFVIISTPATNPANGDHEIIIELQTGSRSIRTGTWTFTLTGSGCSSSPCVTNGAFDVWIDDTSSSATFNPGYRDPFKTVGMPGTATKVITVGAYTTKTSWTSSNGSGTDFYGTVGHISYFSSLGPRRSCSNTSNPVCTAVVQKPELAAPGEEIMSSHAAGTTTTGVCFDTTTPTKCLDPDGKHIIFQGTSMATPHVAGAAALLLAQNPALTSDQVKAALEHTRTDSFTSSTPNNTWGYGKLAVDLAIASVGTTTTTTTTTSTTTTSTTTTSTTTTTTIPNQPPSADSLSPVNIITTPSVAQSFTAVYSDPDGYQNISNATLLVSGNTHNERVDYSAATNKFTLMGAGGNCSPGQAATLSDGDLTLNCASSSTAGSGTTLTVVFNLTPQPSLSGAPYQLMISVIDQGGASNSKTPGTWIINRPPSADSVSPMNSTTAVGTAQTFTAVYSDPDGWQNIAVANFYLSGNGGVHNEWLHYLVAPNQFTMLGTTDVCNPGQATTISNGFLTLDCSASGISGSGNVLTVTFHVTPQPPSSGLQYNIFTAAIDQAGAAHAILAGTWKIQ